MTDTNSESEQFDNIVYFAIGREYRLGDYFGPNPEAKAAILAWHHQQLEAKVAEPRITTEDEQERLNCVQCWRSPQWLHMQKYYCSPHYQNQRATHLTSTNNKNEDTHE